MNVGVRFSWHFSLSMKSANNGDNWNNWYHLRLLFAMKFYIFRVETTLCDPSPLHWCNWETRQLNGRKSSCRRFYYIDRGTTCFGDIPSFRSKLSKTLWSIIRWFVPLKKGAKQAAPKIPLRRFYYLYRSHYSDMSWHSIHILVGIVESFFDDFLSAEQRWKANLAQYRSRFWNPISQLFTGVCQVCLITQLVKIVVSLLKRDF